MNSSDGHQVVHILLNKVGHAAIQRKLHDFVVVHTAHVEDLLLGIYGEALWKEVLRRHSECHASFVYRRIAAAHLLDHRSELRVRPEGPQRWRLGRLRIKTGVELHTLFQLRQSLLQFAEMRVLPRQQKECRSAIGNLGQNIFDRANLSSYFLRVRTLNRTCRRTSRRSGRGRLSRNGNANAANDKKTSDRAQRAHFLTSSLKDGLPSKRLARRLEWSSAFERAGGLPHLLLARQVFPN